MKTPPTAPFFTPDWFAIMEEELQALIDASDENKAAMNFVISERYSDVPDGIVGSADGKAGVTTAIVGGRARVIGASCAEHNIQIDSIWEDVARSVRLLGDEYDAFRKWRAENGRIGFSGDPAGMPLALAGLHDAVARRTQ